MSRGDEAKAELGSKATRARGAAIAAACVVFVLAAGFLTLWATNGIERLFAGGGPFGRGSVPAEPFAGARGAVATVGWHGCLGAETGPTVGVAAALDSARVDAILATRGYLAEGQWSEPLALPIESRVEGLDSACGLYAVVVEEGGHLSTGSAGSDPQQTACDTHVLLLGACGGATVRALGVGTARVRSFAAPGLTPDTLRAIGLPVDVVLAHADAASALSLAGWTASDEIIGVRVPASTAYGLTVRPPRTPAAGCTAYVAVGVGLGHARIYWPGNALREESTVDRFVATPVACGGSPVYFDGTINLEDADGDGGRVWFRAFTPARGGPSVPAAAARRPLAFTMHIVRTADAVMPTPVPALPAP